MQATHEHPIFIRRPLTLSTYIAHQHKSYHWLSARLWYLHCISNGDTTVLHWAIDVIDHWPHQQISWCHKRFPQYWSLVKGIHLIIITCIMWPLALAINMDVEVMTWKHFLNYYNKSWNVSIFIRMYYTCKAGIYIYIPCTIPRYMITYPYIRFPTWPQQMRGYRHV